MILKIIKNEQTPKVSAYKNVKYLIQDRKFLEKFLSFAWRQPNCVGLAANQVSVDGARIMEMFFAMKIKDLHNNRWSLIIDPCIISVYGKPMIKKESCFTWPGKTIIAERYPEIEVSYFDMNGDKEFKTITGQQAQIWQHEIHHLKGIEEKFEEGK